MTKTENCWCGQAATQYVDSDSTQFQEKGQPVCDEHAEDRDPFEPPIVWKKETK
jgi:hypothetical protein